MLSGNCTEALSIQANVTISGPSTKLIKNGIAPLPFPLPALLKQYWYVKRGEGQGEGTCSILCNVRVHLNLYSGRKVACKRSKSFISSGPLISWPLPVNTLGAFHRQCSVAPGEVGAES